jgi:hypothetical protein
VNGWLLDTVMRGAFAPAWHDMPAAAVASFEPLGVESVNPFEAL